MQRHPCRCSRPWQVPSLQLKGRAFVTIWDSSAPSSSLQLQRNCLVLMSTQYGVLSIWLAGLCSYPRAAFAMAVPSSSTCTSHADLSQRLLHPTSLRHHRLIPPSSIPVPSLAIVVDFATLNEHTFIEDLDIARSKVLQFKTFLSHSSKLPGKLLYFGTRDIL